MLEGDRTWKMFWLTPNPRALFFFVGATWPVQRHTGRNVPCWRVMDYLSQNAFGFLSDGMLIFQFIFRFEVCGGGKKTLFGVP